MIIDAHLHITNGFQGLTGAGRTESLELGMARQGDQIHQVLPPINPGKTVFPPETWIQFMNWVGIDKAVLLQGSFYGDQNQYLYETCQCWPDRFLPAAFLDPHASDVRDQFLQVTNEYGFRILKFEMSQPTGFTGVYPNLRLDGPEMSWIWEAAEQQELVVTLDLGKGRTPAYQTREVQTLIQRHPSLVVVIAHLAQPPLGKQGDRELNDLWEEQILLGQNANVWFDISALPAYQDEEYPFAAGSSGAVVDTSVQLQGSLKLDPMWEALVESADRFNLTSIRLNLFLPRLHEHFFATWKRKSNQPTECNWAANFPLVIDGETVGRLEVNGVQKSESMATLISHYLDFLEPLESQLQNLLQEETEIETDNSEESSSSVESIDHDARPA